MPNGDEVQFQSPTTGKVQAVPPEHWDEALKQGYKPTTHKVMYSPDGQRGMIRNEQMRDYQQRGYQTTPKTEFERAREPANRPGFWGSAGTAAKNLLGGALETGGAAGPEAAVLGARLGGQIGGEDVQRKLEHRSVPYRTVAALGTGIGVPARQMEEAADIGDRPGVLGAAVPMTAATLAPEAMRLGGKMRAGVGEYIHDPITGKLTPGSRAVARGTGAAGGALLGGALSPESYHLGALPGMYIGREFGPTMMERMFPGPEPLLTRKGPFSSVSTGPGLYRGKAPAPVPTTPFPSATPSSAVLGTAEVPKLPPNLAAGPEVPGVNAPLRPKVSPTPSRLDISQLPEPIQRFENENPGYMASVPRKQLLGLASTGKLGAGEQLQQLGQRVLYTPRGVISGERVPLPSESSGDLPQGSPTLFPESELEALRRGAPGESPIMKSLRRNLQKRQRP